MQQPSQRDASWRLTELATQLLVGLQLRSELLDLLLHPVIGSAPLAGLLQHTPEQAAAQWAVRDESQTEGPQRGDDLQLDGAGGEAVDALLRHQAHEVAGGGDALRGGDLPPAKLLLPR
jgi:hypothetical protein